MGGDWFVATSGPNAPSSPVGEVPPARRPGQAPGGGGPRPADQSRACALRSRASSQTARTTSHAAPMSRTTSAFGSRTTVRPFASSAAGRRPAPPRPRSGCRRPPRRRPSAPRRRSRGRRRRRGAGGGSGGRGRIGASETKGGVRLAACRCAGGGRRRRRGRGGRGRRAWVRGSRAERWPETFGAPRRLDRLPHAPSAPSGHLPRRRRRLHLRGPPSAERGRRALRA